MIPSSRFANPFRAAYGSKRHTRAWNGLAHVAAQEALHKEKAPVITSTEVRAARDARRAYERARDRESREQRYHQLSSPTDAQAMQLRGMRDLMVPEVKPLHLDRLAYAGDWE